MLEKPKKSENMREKSSIDTVNLPLDKSDNSQKQNSSVPRQSQKVLGKLAEARVKNISEQVIPASDYIEEIKTGEKKKANAKQVMERTKKVQEGLKILEQRNKERRMNSTQPVE